MPNVLVRTSPDKRFIAAGVEGLLPPSILGARITAYAQRHSEYTFAAPRFENVLSQPRQFVAGYSRAPNPATITLDQTRDSEDASIMICGMGDIERIVRDVSKGVELNKEHPSRDFRVSFNNFFSMNLPVYDHACVLQQTLDLNPEVFLERVYYTQLVEQYGLRLSQQS